MHSGPGAGPLLSSIEMLSPEPRGEHTPPDPPALLMSLGQLVVLARLLMFWICRAKMPGRLPAGLVSVMVPSTYWPGSMPAAATLDVLITVLQAELSVAVQSLAPLIRAEAAPVTLGFTPPMAGAKVPAAISVIVRTPAAKLLPGLVVVAVNVAKVPTLTRELTIPTPITVRQAFLNTLSFISLLQYAPHVYLGR